MELGAVDREAQPAEVGFAGDGDDRGDDVFHQCGHDRPERGADDHADGEVDDVATEYERLEVLEHVSPPVVKRP